MRVGVETVAEVTFCGTGEFVKNDNFGLSVFSIIGVVVDAVVFAAVVCGRIGWSSENFIDDAEQVKIKVRRSAQQHSSANKACKRLRTAMYYILCIVLWIY